MWCVIRTVYYERDHTALLLDAIRPLVEELRHRFGLSRILVRPHWVNGPHLDLVMDADAEVFRDAIFPHGAAVLSAWLKAHPSTTVLDEAAFLEQCRAMAVIENEDRPVFPLNPNNTVLAGDYHRAAPLDIAEFGEARDDFLSDSLDVLFEVCAAARNNRGTLFRYVVGLLASVGAVRPNGDYAFWPLSFVAHVQGFLLSNPKAGERFAAAATKLADMITAQLLQLGLSQGTDQAPGDDAILTRWISALRRLDERLKSLVSVHHAEINRRRFPPGVGGGAEPDVPTNLPQPPPELMSNDDVPMFKVFKTALHMNFRFMINFVYMTLPVVTISGAERACLCYAIAEVCMNRLPDIYARAEERMRALQREAALLY